MNFNEGFPADDLGSDEERLMVAMAYALAEELDIPINRHEPNTAFDRRLNEALRALSPQHRDAALDRAMRKAQTSNSYSLVTSNNTHGDRGLLPTVMICAICTESLNVFTDRQGRETVQHSRSWTVHDHDPQPVDIDREDHTNQICDFCGRDEPMMWSFTGTRIQVYDKASHTDRDYGSIWNSCERCAAYIRVGDVETLIDRVMRASAVLRGMGARTDQTQREALLRLHGKFIPSITETRYIGPPLDVPPLHPRMIPKIRDGVVRFWASETAWQRLSAAPKVNALPGFAYGNDIDALAAQLFDTDPLSALATGQADRLFNEGFRVRRPGNEIPREAYTATVKHLVAGLHTADLFYISEEFTRLAVQAGLDLPDLSITREEMPSPFGFCVWAQPIGQIPRPNGNAGVRALSWTLVPYGVWVNVYFQPEDGDPHYLATPEDRQEVGYLLSPNTGVGLPFVNMGKMPDHGENNILATLLATWFLMRQPGVATERDQSVDKGLTRSYKRAGRPAPTVKVVDLRRQVRTRPENETAEEMIRRKISVRFLVRGHWKRQAYGPKRGLRKTIYVAPFMKGPDGAPLKVEIPTVKVLR